MFMVNLKANGNDVTAAKTLTEKDNIFTAISNIYFTSFNVTSGTS